MADIDFKIRSAQRQKKLSRFLKKNRSADKPGENETV